MQKPINHSLIYFLFFCLIFILFRYISAEWLIPQDMLFAQVGLILGRYKVRFGKVFKVAILAECVFILPILLKFLWFAFFVESYTIANRVYEMERERFLITYA